MSPALTTRAREYHSAFERAAPAKHASPDPGRCWPSRQHFAVHVAADDLPRSADTPGPTRIRGRLLHGPRTRREPRSLAALAPASTASRVVSSPRCAIMPVLTVLSVLGGYGMLLSATPKWAVRGTLGLALTLGFCACVVLADTGRALAAANPSFGRTDYSVGRGPTNVVATDVNEDGNVDLVVSNANDNSFSVLFGNGTGSFGMPVTFAAGGTSPYGLAVADLNRDGHKDVVLANRLSNSISILLGDGKGSFTFLRSLVTGSQPLCVKAVDLKEDGALDLVVCHVGQTWVATYFGDGRATSQRPQGPTRLRTAQPPSAWATSTKTDTWTSRSLICGTRRPRCCTATEQAP